MRPTLVRPRGRHWGRWLTVLGVLLSIGLAALVSEIVRTPDMREKLFNQGWVVVGSSPEGLANRIKADTAVMGALIQAQGIRAE